MLGYLRVIIFRPYSNMEGKSSTQHERFSTLTSQLSGQNADDSEFEIFITNLSQICLKMLLK